MWIADCGPRMQRRVVGSPNANAKRRTVIGDWWLGARDRVAATSLSDIVSMPTGVALLLSDDVGSPASQTREPSRHIEREELSDPFQ